MDIIYTFQGASGAVDNFTVALDDQTLDLQHDEGVEKLPRWAALAYQQCPHCPLKPETTPHCPVARAMVRIVHFSNKFKSYDPLAVKVKTEDRTILTKTQAQNAFSSLIGLMTATSGCPHTAFFKPMARFHLPFSTIDETIYRVVSMYLLGRYFHAKRSGRLTADMVDLKQTYENVEVVNLWMTNRLRAAAETDASLNAVICLDTFAKTMLSVIEEQLDELEYLFTGYLAQVKEPAAT